MTDILKLTIIDYVQRIDHITQIHLCIHLDLCYTASSRRKNAGGDEVKKPNFYKKAIAWIIITFFTFLLCGGLLGPWQQ